jgi:hypothetical protein
MKRLIMVACILLAACGESEDAKQAEDRETVFDPLTQQVDKAKAVEDTVEQHKRDLDEALEKTEGRDEH